MELIAGFLGTLYITLIAGMGFLAYNKPSIAIKILIKIFSGFFTVFGLACSWMVARYFTFNEIAKYNKDQKHADFNMFFGEIMDNHAIYIYWIAGAFCFVGATLLAFYFIIINLHSDEDSNQSPTPNPPPDQILQ